MTACRVLVATVDFPPDRGGIQHLVHRLVANFDAARPRVYALDTDGAAEWDRAHGLDVHRVPASADRRLSIARLNAAVIAEALRRRPDVFMAMHIVLAPAVAVIRRLLGVPTLTYVYADEVVAFPRVARVALGHSTRVVSISRYTSGLALAARADDRRITLIPPGVDWAAPPVTPRDPRPTIVTVARLEDRYKGHEVVMRALPIVRERVPDVQWMVVGDGSLRAELERLTVNHGVEDRVHFCGAVSDLQRDQMLDRAHVFAMPSRVPLNGGGEGFGIVYLEAGVHGLPVVAGGVGGAVDAVVDEVTGLLVDPTDHTAVAAALARLLEDRSLAARMGAAASERARDFAWPEIARRVEELIFDVKAAA
jgi:phosphatidylinositol alpha-1,6-mannosyltransferase